MKTSLRWFAPLPLLSVALAGPTTAHAQLLGDTVNGTYFFPDLSTPIDNEGNQVVSPTASFTYFGQLTSTVSASTITVSFNNSNFFNPAAFNGFVITDTTASPITAVFAFSNLPGFDASNVSFTGNSVSVNLQSVVFNPTSFVQIDVNAVAVPEAGSLALLGFAVLPLALVVRRRLAKA